MLAAFIHGYALTFSLILPLGPQNMFMVNEGASTSRVSQLMLIASVLALCDSVIIIISVLGAAEAIRALPQLKMVLMLLGIAFLLYMGVRNIRSYLASLGQDDTPRTYVSFKQKIIYALSVSVLNPHAFFDSVTVIGGAAAAYSGEAKLAFVGAAVLNSWVRFVLLAYIGKFISNYPRVRNMLALISGITMLVCAAMLGSLLFSESTNI